MTAYVSDVLGSTCVYDWVSTASDLLLTMACVLSRTSAFFVRTDVNDCEGNLL